MSSATRPAETRDGTVTSWIAMTTTFSSPPECGTNFISDIGGGAISSFMGYLPLGMDVKGTRDRNISCLPDPVTSWMEQQINNPQTQLSLGPMECPDRYTIATSSVINTDTTFYQCCPSSFGLSPISQTRFGNPRVSISLQPDCSSLLTPLQVFSYSEFLRDGGTVTTRVITTTATNGGALVAYPIKGYKFASLAATTIGSTSSNNGAPTLASFSSVAIATQSSPAGTQNAKPLSTAAAIGIGCVAVTAVVLLISIIAFCLLKRRKRKASVISAEKVAEPIEGLNGDINLEQACGPNAHELGQSKQLSEMHSEREIRELSSQTPPLELESGGMSNRNVICELDSGYGVR